MCDTSKIPVKFIDSYGTESNRWIDLNSVKDFDIKIGSAATDVFNIVNWRFL